MISVSPNSLAPAASQGLRPAPDPAASPPPSSAPAAKADVSRPPAASWTFSDGLAARSDAISTVSGSLQRAQSMLDATLAAGPSLTGLLSQAQSSAAQASGADLAPEARQQISDRYDGLLKQIDATVGSATFDGASLIDKSAASYQPLSAPASADGAIAINVDVQDLSAASGLGLTAGALATPAGAAGQAAKLGQGMDQVNGAMGRFADAARAVDSQLSAVTKLHNSLTTGAGAASAEATVAQDSVGLQALQLKQQLTAGGFSIANGAPQAILSLFKAGSGG